MNITSRPFLHKYETFKRKDGHTVKLPMDRGEGQNWRTAPGNLFSKPQKINLKASTKQTIALVMDQVNPAIAPLKDTKFIKHIQVQSKRLTEFWGRPMFIGANLYYDDSYAVNSENLGPYGDAIMYELLPEIEKRFWGIGQGWARFTYGGSTGGWEALAAQVFYPNEFNGCFAACPDPIAFDTYTVFNLYKDKNAYYSEGPFRRTPRPGQRNYLGQVKCTLEETNLRELALGTHSRSGDQFDIWEAVYSPVGADGYPKRIWDKRTGEIDPTVAAYWREHYDLLHILRRDWETLSPKVTGKIHIYCGDMDNYYLNNAVYLMEDFLKSVQNPSAKSEVAYGDRAEHCWNGDPTQPNYISRLRYNTMYVDKILRRIEANHPAGADLKSWRY